VAAARPIRSMTGAGAAVSDGAAARFEAEARSVNHRFLKTTARASGRLPPLEGAIEDAVRSLVERGHVSVSVRCTVSTAEATRIDEAAFTVASERLKRLAESQRLPAPTVADVLAIPGVVDAAGDEEHAPERAAQALETVRAALAKMNSAREREGDALRREMTSLLDAVSRSTGHVARLAESVPSAAKARIESRLAELLGPTVSLDPTTVAREVALLADRTDVREEVARLQAHAAHAREILDEGGSVGRRLDFLVQEMHREANTIGSKCDDLEITRAVLAIKADVERLREQAQNVE
jgi:uncharacterized protein (TIGR00255 family)